MEAKYQDCMQCEGCNRLILKEHGPLCSDCTQTKQLSGTTPQDVVRLEQQLAAAKAALLNNEDITRKQHSPTTQPATK